MPKLTVIEKTIQALNEKIDALVLARKHLEDEQQKTQKKKRGPRVVVKVSDQSAS